MIGLWPNVSHTGFWESLVSTSERLHINWVNFHTIIIDNSCPINTQSPDKLELYKAIKQSSRRKIYIANKNMYKAKDIFSIDYHVEIHENDWFDRDYEFIFNSVKEKIELIGEDQRN